MLTGRRAVRGPRAAEARTEALRVLRSNLLVAVADLDHPVVVVTSANPGEGKTATCAGLAASLAATGRKVVAVDLDLRQPELHLRLGVGNDVGVVDVVTDRCPLAEAIQPVEVGAHQGAVRQGFYLLAAGQSVANPTELLGLPTMARLLGSIAAQADLVLVDTAPVLPVADTLVVARMAAGALLVVEAGRTSEADVRAAGDALARSEVRVLGVTLNKLDAREVRLGYGDTATTVAALGGLEPAASGGKTEPAGSGGKRQPAGSEGKRQPAGSEGKRQPAGSEGKTEPAGSGGKRQPAGSGGKRQPAGSGGKTEPAGSGGKTEPAGSGGKRQPAGSGGKTEPAGSGGKGQPAGSGGKAAGTAIPRAGGWPEPPG